MKVFIVLWEGAFDDWNLVKVFSTKEKAESYLEGKSSSFSYVEQIVE